MSNSIIVKGCGVRQEALAAGTIKPGQLVKLDSNGKFAVHSTAGGIAAKRFAVENDLCGKGVGDAYSAGQLAQANVFLSGDEIQAFLKANENVAVGDFLESDGSGNLQKLTTGVALAIAKETKNPSADTLIKIEII